MVWHGKSGLSKPEKPLWTHVPTQSSDLWSDRHQPDATWGQKSLRGWLESMTGVRWLQVQMRLWISPFLSLWREENNTHCARLWWVFYYWESLGIELLPMNGAWGGGKKYNIQFTLLTIFSVQYSSVNYTHIVVQQISRNFSSCHTETLYLSNHDTPSPSSSSSWQPSFYSLRVWLL